MQLSFFGFDVSFYQDDNNTPQKIDFQRMKDYGASFVIIKTGQWFYKDPDFQDYWRDAKAAGMPRSAYWFCDKNSLGRTQAALFWNLVKDDPAEGMYFADYESGSWTDWRQLKEFVQEFQRLSGLPNSKIGIYTAYGYWFDYGVHIGPDSQFFAGYPLWVAHYTSNPENILIPLPWTDFIIWQSGTPAIGQQVGVESREVDFNWFNGNLEKLQNYLRGIEPIPPEGATMYNCRVFDTANPYINLRATPNGVDIGDVPPGTEFVADGIENDTLGRPWLHSVTTGMVGYLAAWLCSYEVIPTTGEKPIIKVTLEAEGYPTLVIDWSPDA